MGMFVNPSSTKLEVWMGQYTSCGRGKGTLCCYLPREHPWDSYRVQSWVVFSFRPRDQYLSVCVSHSCNLPAGPDQQVLLLWGSSLLYWELLMLVAKCICNLLLPEEGHKSPEQPLWLPVLKRKRCPRTVRMGSPLRCWASFFKKLQLLNVCYPVSSKGKTEVCEFTYVYPSPCITLSDLSQFPSKLCHPPALAMFHTTQSFQLLHIGYLAYFSQLVIHLSPVSQVLCSQ